MIGFILASVLLEKTSTFPFSWENQTFYDCRAELSDQWAKIYMTSNFIITFAIPLIIQVFVYVSIGSQLLKEKQLNLRKSIQQSDTRKVSLYQQKFIHIIKLVSIDHLFIQSNLFTLIIYSYSQTC